MKFDFTRPITTYEFLALIVAIVAFLQPHIQSLWKRFFQKAELKFYPNNIILFFNKSGSYLRLEGVYEAINRNIIIRRIDARIKAKIDSRELNLKWETFYSPFTQNLGNVSSQINEKAHAFRVDKDGVTTLFVEFSDIHHRAEIIINEKIKKLSEHIADISQQNKQITNDEFIKLKEYEVVKNAIDQELFWLIGEYEINMEVKYNDNQKKSFKFHFIMDESNYEKISANSTEILKTYYPDFDKGKLCIYSYTVPLEDGK